LFGDNELHIEEGCELELLTRKKKKKEKENSSVGVVVR
jgi:hypothetical protein